jgi:eukaryotic-like serine/threonine-protein kinase
MAADWDLLQAIFEGALDRPTAERAAFLDESTNGDSNLRREIESLLAAHDAAGEFLSAPALGTFPEPMAGGELHAASSGPARFTSGTSLGAFTILEPLGSGGMGEVYRARDVRLDRLVAIKVLSSGRDTAPGARERFEREARAISRLSHPRICTVHDVGVAELSGSNVPYLVMELLDGETLAAKIARGPLTIEQSLAYAIDIADALIAAHAQGIVHRDLKPANVMVTATGIKLLDFGLAQLRGAVPAGAPAPAVSSVSGLTSEGLVFGTLPYISPEQLRAERVDARTDIFAFGALLYEMLTGGRPFAADSQAGLIAAILEHEAPPVSDRLPLAPASLDRIVQKCLAKNPDDRWQTARDLKSELVWLREGREEVLRQRPARGQPRSWRWRQTIAVAVATTAALILAAMVWRGTIALPGRTPARTVTRLSLNLPAGVTLFIPVNGTSIAIAPDGSRIAYIGSREGATFLFIYTLATGMSVEVPETREAGAPMFSSDSQWVAFGQAGSIKKVPAQGGPIQLIAKDAAAGTMVWLSDGRFARGNGSGVPISELFPKKRELIPLAEGEEGHLTPLLLPGGALLFTALRGGLLSTRSSINVYSPQPEDSPAGLASEVVPNASFPQLLDRNALAFTRGRALFAAGFDSRAIRLTSEPLAMGIQVQTTQLSVAPMYAVADNGTLVYAEWAGGRRLVWVDRSGREEYVEAPDRMYSGIRLSPDGMRVAVSLLEDDRDLWVIALDGSAMHKVTSGPAPDGMPVWSRDGREIFFTTAQRIINRVPSDGATAPQTIFTQPKPDRLFPLSIAFDGKQLLMQSDLLPKYVDLRVLTLGSTPQLTPLAGGTGVENGGQLSPDGKWVVYQSSESTGGREGNIMVRPFPETQSFQRIVSAGIGRQPLWSSDGRQIFYRTEDGTVMSVPITTTTAPPSLVAGTPVRVVSPSNTIREWAAGPNYSVSPDGRRFLFIKAPELDIRSLKVVLNWDVAVNAVISGKER